METGEEASDIPYTKWIKELQIEDVENCHVVTEAFDLLCTALDPNIDEIRIQENLQGEYLPDKKTYKFKIWRSTDLIHGFYSPVPITDVKMSYKTLSVELKAKIALKDAGNGQYLFKYPIPICGMPMSQLAFECALEQEPSSEMNPIRLIAGILRSPKRNDLISGPVSTPQKILFSKGGSELESIYLECLNFLQDLEGWDRHWKFTN